MTGTWIACGSEEWNAFLRDGDHDIYHTPEYVSLEAAGDTERAGAFLADSDAGSLFLPLILRQIPGSCERWGAHYHDAISPYGYPGPLIRERVGHSSADVLSATMSQLEMTLRERNVVSCFVRSHPILSGDGEPFRRFGTVVEHGRTVSMDLSQSSETSWSTMRSNHRRDIRKAERAGIRIEIDHDWAHLDTFVDLYHRTMERHRASESYFFSRAYFQEMVEQMSDRLTLCLATMNGEVVAASLYSTTCGIVQYMLSGTADAEIKLHPLKSMIFFMQGWARERGNRFLHLGGGLGGREDALFDFKQGFSGHYHTFWSCRMIVDEARYGALIAHWEQEHGTASESSTGFFPAYRKPF